MSNLMLIEMWLENLVEDSYLFSPAATMGIENRI